MKRVTSITFHAFICEVVLAHQIEMISKDEQFENISDLYENSCLENNQRKCKYPVLAL